MTLTTDTIGTLSLLANQGTPISIVKLIQFVESLSASQKAELMALMRTGRDGGDFDSHLTHARNLVDDSVGYYMAEQGPALSEYLGRGWKEINR